LDAAGSANGTVVPAGVERIAVLATGGNADPGLAGWHSGQEVAYAGWSSAVVAGAVVRAEGASVRSTRERFRAGWIHAADLVTGTNVVVTRFTLPFHTLAVLVDDPLGSDAARGLSLAIDGADRAKGADGNPVPPLVVVAGNRSILIYQVVPAATPAPLPVTVSIASQDGWHLAGVMAGDDTPAAIADRFTRNGRDALVQPLVPSHGASVQISWAAGVLVPGTQPKAAKTAAVKRAAPKKAASKKTVPKKKAASKKAAPKRRKS
jgi:hypothetical protein